MKKLLLLICLVLIMTGCTAENDLTVDTNPENSENVVQPAEEASVLLIDEGLSEIEKARKDVYENHKVAEVPKGTKVNIIERKLTRAKVRILDDIYKGNEVWVLIESIKD
jgi:PBP1b-binding outer membrane lipoprotein LpoB